MILNYFSFAANADIVLTEASSDTNNCWELTIISWIGDGRAVEESSWSCCSLWSWGWKFCWCRWKSWDCHRDSWDGDWLWSFLTWWQSTKDRSSNNLWVIDHRLVNRTDSSECISVNSSECCWRHSSWNLVNTVHGSGWGSGWQALSSGWLIRLSTLACSRSTNCWCSTCQIFVTRGVEGDNSELSLRTSNASRIR